MVLYDDDDDDDDDKNAIVKCTAHLGTSRMLDELQIGDARGYLNQRLFNKRGIVLLCLRDIIQLDYHPAYRNLMTNEFNCHFGTRAGVE